MCVCEREREREIMRSGFCSVIVKSYAHISKYKFMHASEMALFMRVCEYARLCE